MNIPKMDYNENTLANGKNEYHIKVKLQTNNNVIPKKKMEKTNMNSVLNEEDYQEPEEENFKLEEVDYETAPVKLVWPNIVVAVILHVGFLYGMSEILTGRVSGWEFLHLFMYGFVTNIGIAAGAHRLWAHRAYKARLPLQIFMLTCQTLAMQNSLYVWVRDHRTHHKFTETHADPHNAKRGVFFAHMGWLLCKKHPDVISKAKVVDMSDLEKDPLIMWQYRNYIWLALISFFVVPTVTFNYLLNWPYFYSFLLGGVTRYVITLHLTWLLNSASHMIGPKPYDQDIYAREGMLMRVLAAGEGYHNYHHVFPWDYKAAEWSGVFLNTTKGFIDLCALLGLAYDLKSVSSDVVQRRVHKKGDGTHPVWGWGDTNIPKQDIIDTEIIYKKE